MRNRLDLHKALCRFMQCPEQGEACRVYFQPPNGFSMKYPCLIYKLDGVQTLFADGRVYRNTGRYAVTMITKNPDPCIVDKMLEFPYCQFDRYYVADNLNHFTFILYY